MQSEATEPHYQRMMRSIAEAVTAAGGLRSHSIDFNKYKADYSGYASKRYVLRTKAGEHVARYGTVGAAIKAAQAREG